MKLEGVSFEIPKLKRVIFKKTLVSDAADEILVVLKNENLKNPEKKYEIEKLVNSINRTTFDHLVSIGILITDYQDGRDGNDNLDDDVGVERISREGSLLMANNSTDENNRIVLPDGSVRILGEGYEEIHVPALEPKPIGSDGKIVSIASIPDWGPTCF